MNKDSGKIAQNLVLKGLTGTKIQLYGGRLAIYLSYSLEEVTKAQGIPLLFASGNTILLPGHLLVRENEAEGSPAGSTVGLIRLVGTKE